MNTKSIIVTIGVAILVAFGVGRYTAPVKVQEKEVIKYVDKVVEKIVEVNNTSSKQNKVVIKFTTIKPDGTKTTELRTYYTNEIEVTSKLVDEKKETTNVDKTTEKVVEYKKDDNILALNAKASLDSIIPTYGLSYQRRIIGPIYLGAFGFTDKTFGLNLGISF